MLLPREMGAEGGSGGPIPRCVPFRPSFSGLGGRAEGLEVGALAWLVSGVLGGHGGLFGVAFLGLRLRDCCFASRLVCVGVVVVVVVVGVGVWDFVVRSFF